MCMSNHVPTAILMYVCVICYGMYANCIMQMEMVRLVRLYHFHLHTYIVSVQVVSMASVLP